MVSRGRCCARPQGGLVLKPGVTLPRPALPEWTTTGSAEPRRIRSSFGSEEQARRRRGRSIERRPEQVTRTDRIESPAICAMQNSWAMRPLVLVGVARDGVEAGPRAPPVEADASGPGHRGRNRLLWTTETTQPDRTSGAGPSSPGLVPRDGPARALTTARGLVFVHWLATAQLLVHTKVTCQICARARREIQRAQALRLRAQSSRPIALMGSYHDH